MRGKNGRVEDADENPYNYSKAKEFLQLQQKPLMNMQARPYANVTIILVMITGGIILELIRCTTGPPAFDLKLNRVEKKVQEYLKE